MAVVLDQHYTKSDVVDIALGLVVDSYDVIIEPSAGSGAFSVGELMIYNKKFSKNNNPLLEFIQ